MTPSKIVEWLSKQELPMWACTARRLLAGEIAGVAPRRGASADARVAA